MEYQKKNEWSMKRFLQKVVAVMVIITLLAGISPIQALAAEQKESEQTQAELSKTTSSSKKKKTVVLYFSATGTTKGAAKKIQKKTGGTLLEIKAQDPYTDEDLDYYDDNSRVVKEHNSADTPAESTVRPKISNLKAIKKAVKSADVVYIGYPIWWGEAPHIVYTLVENVSLKGKTVVPFCTSVSSGMGASAKHLKAQAKISKKTSWLSGRNFYDVPSQKTVNKWVNKIQKQIKKKK